MSGLQNKNLMFYSTHPNDKLSRMCLAELEKMPELKKQFIPICIHHPQDITKPPLIRLPNIVDQCKNRGSIPILAIAGFEQPIFASAALSWIKESALKLDEGIIPSNIHGGGVADNCSTVSGSAAAGNALFDSDYNIGFSNAKGEFNKGYANIDEAAESRIVTYDEANDRQAASNEIAQRLEQLKFNRDVDAPQAPQRMGGGIPQAGGYMQQQGQGGMPQMPGYGQQGGMPQMPQMPQYGQQMPQYGQQMPQMPQYGQQMPQMPQYGQQMPQMPQQGYGPQVPQYQIPQTPQQSSRHRVKHHRR